MTAGLRIMDNKRLRERVRFQSEVILTTDTNERTFSKVKDISMNGLFIETEDPLPLNAAGEMNLILSFGEKEVIIKSKFRVLRVTDLKKNCNEENLQAGFGIGLMDFEEDSSEELYNVIKYNEM